MAFVPIENSWRCTINGAYMSSGQQTANVLHIYDPGPHDLARAEALANAVAGVLTGGDKAMFHSHFHFTSVVVMDDELEDGVVYISTAGLPVTGTATGDPAGGQVCAITTLTTGGRGRSRRGRIFWPALSNSFINAADGTTLDSDEIANYDAIVGDIMDAIDGLDGTATLGVESKTDVAIYPVTGWQTRSWLGTQRRRVGG